MRKTAVLLCLIPSLSLADASEDKGWLVNFLQDNLSGAGRQVTIDGFQGALSSQASLTRMTIADDQGVWLTLKDVTLDWNRTALLSGRIEVESLKAQSIDLDRLPEGDTTPSPEAKPFALPDLPVSVAIAEVAAPLIRLGPGVLGQEVIASLSADLTLEGGAGRGQVNLTRKDALGRVLLAASYGNADQVLSLDLDAAEGAGGIAATRLGVPGAPATSLRIAGKGPLSDFTAQVNLATDGTTRLGGLVTLRSGAFSALLAGDPTPVFLPDYAAFFGPDVALQVKGSQGPQGLVLDNVAVQAAALTLEGKARFAPGGRPVLLDLTGTLGLDGGAVTLPLTSPVSVTSGDLRLFHDESLGEDWRLTAALRDLVTPELTAKDIALTAEGRLAAGVFDGAAEIAAEGLRAQDPALARALGPTLTAKAQFHSETDGLRIENLSLTAPGLSLTTLGQIGLDGSIQGQIRGQVEDLTRLSLYRPGVSGEVAFDLAGQADALSGAFDLTGSLEGRDLALGQAEADAVLEGVSRIVLSAQRDETGVTLRTLTADTKAVSASLSGRIATGGHDLTGRIAMPDLSVIGRRGSVASDLRLQGQILTLNAEGQGLGLGQVDLDRLLAGRASLTLTADLETLALQAFRIRTDQLTATAQGPLTALQIEARLANLGLFVPEFPGPLTLKGKAGWQDGAVLDLAVQGPGQIAAQVTGLVGTSLTIKGTGAAALANPFLRPRSVAGRLQFDLVLRGLALTGLSGTVQLAEGRLADPSLPFGLARAGANLRLTSGRAEVTAGAEISTGGRLDVAGRIGLAAPHQADLTVTLTRALLRDPQLFETTVSGRMGFRGPALGGAVISGDLALGVTELRIPSTFAGGTRLEGLTHRGDAPAVRATRARAEADSAKGQGSGPGYRLDLRITAPNKVFLRGRGLDAELGGGLTLAGTTNAIRPQGGFSLLRGRMDILGRRLTLSEANLDLQGALVPTVRVLASVAASDITATVTVDGPATAPEVSFSSNPALPQEEVLAQLLFGRGLETMSAFQAAQLASAVATLAGRGGEGIIGNIRSKTGLDNLDVQTGDSGAASLTAGKYLGENLYSEVTVDSGGKSEISLNLDVARHITLKATVGSDGTSGAGVFLKKDY